MILRSLRFVALIVVVAALGLGLMTRPALATAQDTSATPMPAPAPQLPATVQNVSGDEVTISDVSRIVPLSGDIAEIVWSLGLGENVVGVDVSAVYPAEAWADLPQIGFERQLSAEGILSLNPTVVIGKEQAGPPEVLDQLRDAGVPVVIVGEPQTLEAPGAKIRSVAAALGVVEAGDVLRTKVEGEIAAARELAATAADQHRVLFIYVRGGGTQLIGGSGVVSNAMIEAAGGIDAGVEAGVRGFMPVTAEIIVAARPDVIVVPSSGVESIGGLEALLDIPGVAETPAGQAGWFLVYDDLRLLGMTPRTGQMLHEMTLALHPELAATPPEASPVAG